MAVEGDTKKPLLGCIKHLWKMWAAVVALLVMQQQQQLVVAIRCYVCQSNVDPKCADPFDNQTLPATDCDAYPRADLAPKTEFDLLEEKSYFQSMNQPAPVKPLRASMCRKIRQKVNGEWRTIRACGYLSELSGPQAEQLAKGECKIRHGTHDIFMESCACNSKDACNRAGQPQRAFSAPLAGLTALASSYLYLWQASHISGRIRLVGRVQEA